MTQPDTIARTQRIREAIAQAPSKMTMQIARDLEVPEAEVIRQLPDGRAVTLESVGEFGGFSTWGDFFNVQTKNLDMHIRWPNLGAVFAVEKPSHMSGINTLSFQFYDRAGQAALKVFLTFGSTAPSPELLLRFQEIREKFKK
jgi:putative heme iron utilization protein